VTRRARRGGDRDGHDEHREGEEEARDQLRGDPAAQALPKCPDDDESVINEVPSYLRSGASLAFTISRDDDSIAEVEVAYPGPEGQLQERFAFPPDEDEIRVIRTLPQGRSFDLTFTCNSA
jgi:hypothetical protein